MTPHQAVAEVGHSRIVGLIGAVGGLERPPADELALDEPHPEAEPINFPRCRHAARMAGLCFLAGARATAQVAQHLGIGVELDLALEVLVGEWH